MASVATYVFLDLETTGLPSEETNRTKITELSMVAVKRRHLLLTRPGAAPRVQNKLTLCFNPCKMVQPGSTTTTGLCNDLLEHETKFNIDAYAAINSFLNVLTKPVCLIAQNGLNFDFPILKNHLEKLKVTLSDDILCADCYHAFYDILEKAKSQTPHLESRSKIESEYENVDKEEVIIIDSQLSSDIVNECFCEENETKLSMHLPTEKPPENDKTKIKDETVTRKTEINVGKKILAKENTVSIQSADERILSTNKAEITKYKGIDVTDLHLSLDSEAEFFSLENTLPMKSVNEITPKHNKIGDRKEPKIMDRNKISKVRRRFPWSAGSKPKESYKLKNIYERVLQRPGVEAHRAENDCILALEISVALAEEFVHWIDTNHCRFADVKPMTIGVRLGD